MEDTHDSGPPKVGSQKAYWDRVMWTRADGTSVTVRAARKAIESLRLSRMSTALRKADVGAGLTGAQLAERVARDKSDIAVHASREAEFDELLAKTAHADLARPDVWHRQAAASHRIAATFWSDFLALGNPDHAEYFEYHEQAAAYHEQRATEFPESAT